MERRFDATIARLARRQHGVWSRQQALSAGMTAKMIKTRTRSGVWLVLDNGIYSHLASLPTWERSLMAAVLAQPWAVASHQSAAVLHGLLERRSRDGRPRVDPERWPRVGS